MKVEFDLGVVAAIDVAIQIFVANEGLAGLLILITGL